MIYFTSDLHFNHDQPFIYEARGYNNVEEMNLAQIWRFNRTVQPNDECWILGDLIMGELAEGKRYLRELQGKIHVVIENHDSAKRVSFYQDLGWDCHPAAYWKYNKYQFYLSHFPAYCYNLYDGDKGLKNILINLHGHTHSVEKFFAGLYPMYHVGIDAHRYPISIEQIITDIKEAYYGSNLFLHGDSSNCH